MCEHDDRAIAFITISFMPVTLALWKTPCARLDAP